MDIKDHGDFVTYDRPDHPLKAHNVMFCKRVSDGRDWYELQKELRRDDTIKMTVMSMNDEPVVMATSYDATMLFPAGCKLIEVSGATDHHETFRQKVFDGAAFHERKPRPPPLTMTDIIIEELGLDAEKLRQKLAAKDRR